MSLSDGFISCAGQDISTPSPIARSRESAAAARWRWIIWGILATGTLLRLTQYLFNRSLWLDEALLTLNVLRRPWTGLIKPLDYNQGAPVGFLFLEKLSTQVL